jgi:hypothetical protein
VPTKNIARPRLSRQSTPLGAVYRAISRRAAEFPAVRGWLLTVRPWPRASSTQTQASARPMLVLQRHSSWKQHIVLEMDMTMKIAFEAGGNHLEPFRST